jgi:predicted PurR-regulated permease PerM
MTGSTPAADRAPSRAETLRALLDRDREWVRALLVLATIAALFIVLGFLASYFQDYFEIILIFFFAWFIAFLVTPPVDFIQRHAPRMPRAISVILIVIPVVLLIAGIVVVVLVSIVSSLVSLVEEIAKLGASPPDYIGQIQTWVDGMGWDIDVDEVFHTLVTNVLKGMADFALQALGGVTASISIVINTIVVISLGVFMAIDRDKILNFGMELVPAPRREEAVLFRKSVSHAFIGFIRSQLALGAIYGVWAFLVSFILGLPAAAAMAFLSGVIMAIPIYGPYVSWLPPVIVALLFRPDLVIPTAVLMLIGWFIDENILAPIVRAGAVELHPVVVMGAFLLGAHLAGAVGALVAIPIAAIISSFFFYWLKRRREASGEDHPEPVQRIVDVVPGGSPPGDEALDPA